MELVTKGKSDPSFISHSFFFVLCQLQIIAKERDENRRADFRHFISQFDKNQLLFIDESSKDDRTFQVKVHKPVHSGYYMPACGYEFYLRVFNSI